MRSPYSLVNHPPAEPPPGVICPDIWTVQVRWWRRHTPDENRRCRECAGTAAWPCMSWLCWDGQLGDAIAASLQYRAEQEALLEGELVLAALTPA